MGSAKPRKAMAWATSATRMMTTMVAMTKLSVMPEPTLRILTAIPLLRVENRTRTFRGLASWREWWSEV